MAAPRADLPGLLLAMAGVGAGFVVLLGLGFRIAGTPAPAPLPSLFAPACVVFVLVIAYAAAGLRRAGVRLPRPRLVLFERRARQRARKAAETERAVRRARLLADPLRAPYVVRMDAGEPWSDAQIDYDLQPSLTVTCVHLRGVEAAMRAAGISLRMLHGRQVMARCVVDDARLRTHFALAEGVTYREFEAYDRSHEDPPMAHIDCAACASRIEVSHPRAAWPGTPRFPLAVPAT